MKKYFVFFVLFILTFSLNSICVVFIDNTYLAGDFVYIDNYYISIRQGKTLYNIKHDICSKIIDSDGIELRYSEVENTPESCIIASKYKKIITLKKKNFMLHSVDPATTDESIVTLKDGTMEKSVLLGRDEKSFFQFIDGNVKVLLLTESEEVYLPVSENNSNQKNQQKHIVKPLNDNNTILANLNGDDNLSGYIDLALETPVSLRAELMSENKFSYGAGIAFHINKKQFAKRGSYNVVALYAIFDFPLFFVFEPIRWKLGMGYSLSLIDMDRFENRNRDNMYLTSANEIRVFKKLSFNMYSSVLLYEAARFRNNEFYLSLGLRYKLF